MTPKFANMAAWQQAELLMQPVFIRVIDNLRKELEQSSWKGTYRDIPVWEAGTTDETRATVTQLQEELKGASPERTADIEESLARLPKSHPGYQLHLQHQNHEFTIDLWQLCYQICFRNYNPVINSLGDQVVEVDTTLIDDETGDVDWINLDAKAQKLIAQIFASLPK
ncbi:MAG TPA: hypothetical protein V6C78_30060 [Crinalium sp.]|jgi:hypothetical protein